MTYILLGRKLARSLSPDFLCTNSNVALGQIEVELHLLGIFWRVVFSLSKVVSGDTFKAILAQNAIFLICALVVMVLRNLDHMCEPRGGYHE